MGEPGAEVKSENVSPSKKVNSEPTEDAPEAKRIKLDDSEENGVTAKEENGVTVKEENGSASEPTAEERGEPELEGSIVHQIEYYFGDMNLPKDKFLLEQIKLEDGWVPLSVMLKFSRLAQLSKTPSTIATAVRNLSKLMEVNDDGTKIRRSPNKPLPEMNEEWQKQVNERTVYCKGFPQTELNMGKYLEFFKQYGPVEHINLRKYVDRTTKKLMFKGSAYVLFESKELADKFLALESVIFEGTELLRMTQAAHSEQKNKEKNERWGKKVKKEGAPADDNAKPKRELYKGCILKIKDIKDEELTREVIKSTLIDLGADVAFIEFSKGDKESLVRLNSKEDGAGTQFMKKLSDNGEKVKFGDTEMEVEVLEGEEEEAYLQRSRDNMERTHKNFKRGKQHHRGGGFRHKRGRMDSSR